jgi:hypothetical protein
MPQAGAQNVPYQPTSTAPAPGTSTGNNWDDFLNVLRGGVAVGQQIAATVQAGRSPSQQGGGYAGTTYPMPQQYGPASNDSGLFLIVAVVVILLVMD